MSSSTNTFKRITVGLLCLLLLTGLIFIGADRTEVDAAGGWIKRIEITTDRALHQYTDIAAFLKSVKLVYPKASIVKEFNFYLYYMNSYDEAVHVTSGKAGVRTYIFDIEITLMPGYFFDSDEKIKATLNGTTGRLGAIPAGESDSASCVWWLKALPRYKVTFNTDGGKPVPAVQWVVKGQKAKVPKQPTKSGYTFDGWWRDVSKNSTKWNFNQKVNQALPLIARWKPVATATTPTTTTTTTTTTTPLETEPPTTTPEPIEPTTTEASIEVTTTPDTVMSDTTSNERDDTKDRQGFDFKILLYVIGGAALVFIFGAVAFILGRKSK